jgi:hypothetical protein
VLRYAAAAAAASVWKESALYATTRRPPAAAAASSQSALQVAKSTDAESPRYELSDATESRYRPDGGWSCWTSASRSDQAFDAFASTCRGEWTATQRPVSAHARVRPIRGIAGRQASVAALEGGGTHTLNARSINDKSSPRTA